METCSLSGDIFVAIATVLAVVITGIISFFITRWQVKKQGKETIEQLELQYQNTLRRMQVETSVLIKRKQYDLTLKALQKCWGLLIYTTDNENQKSIITYTVEKTKENGQEKNNYIYYFNKTNIDSFIESLRNYFYEKGWGLYLSKELKEQLFGYERILWGLKLRGEKLDDNKQKIENPQVAESLFEIHKNLIVILREDMFDIKAPDHTHIRPRDGIGKSA
ncbi:hypothetical protein FACS189440_00940 [Bacteroidia bacterium]|nr:hypothetical protein FACS189440_00940 [Bacteroidia bacterium]